MRMAKNLSFILAAVFSLVAISTNFLVVAGWVTWVALALAAACLVVGLYIEYRNQPSEPIVIGEDREEILREMKADGNEAGAIAQVQMWYRQASSDDAARIVRELK